MQSLKIIQLAIGEIQESPVNSRTHSPEQISQIKASISQFGFVNPCLVDQDNVLIAGHGRLESARQLGLKKVPVIQLGHLSEAQARALRISDNSIALNAGWNFDVLNAELDALEALDFDLAPLGLADIVMPELDAVDAAPVAPKAPRKSSTIFVTVPNNDAERARTVIAKALDKARITHNL